MTVGSLFSGVMSEMKNSPFTSVVAMLALAGVLVFLPMYLDSSNTAQRVAALESTVKHGQLMDTRNNLEGRIKELERDIFDLQVKIRSLDSPDEFFNKQLAQWSAEHEQLKDRHRALLQKYPELLAKVNDRDGQER